MNKFVILLATILHLIPHPFGVSSIGATALYAGAFGPKRTSWIVPMIPMFVAGVVFGFYDLTVMAFVFGGFGLSTLAGRWCLSRKRNYPQFCAAIVAGASIFFLISNFAIWLVGMYPPTVAGLMQCYVNGLPYFGQAVIADAAFCFVLFGLHSLIERSDAAAVIA